MVASCGAEQETSVVQYQRLLATKFDSHDNSAVACKLIWCMHAGVAGSITMRHHMFLFLFVVHPL